MPKLERNSKITDNYLKKISEGRLVDHDIEEGNAVFDNLYFEDWQCIAYRNRIPTYPLELLLDHFKGIVEDLEIRIEKGMYKKESEAK